jgi:protein-disulfide isomerase
VRGGLKLAAGRNFFCRLRHFGVVLKPLWPVLALGTLFSVADAAEPPAALLYSGRVASNGKAFDGTGYFVFSIEESNGVIWWRSGELPYAGATNLPPGTLSLPVQNGGYSTRLGDSSLGMPPLDRQVLRRAVSPLLRVWFNDGTNGWRRTGEDVPLAGALSDPSEGNGSPITTEQANALIKEIRELRALLEPEKAAPRVVVADSMPAPTATISIKESPFLGRADAPLVLVEFTDFECPYCKQAHDTALAGLKAKYIESGKLRLVCRQLALPFHPHAELAARAAICAGEQGQFWPMRDRLFSIAPALGETNLLRAAQELNLDLTAFSSCLQGPASGEQVRKDKLEADAAGIRGTPTFVLGTADGDKVTGEILAGAQNFAFFDMEIQKRLPRDTTQNKK